MHNFAILLRLFACHALHLWQRAGRQTQLTRRESKTFLYEPRLPAVALPFSRPPPHHLLLLLPFALNEITAKNLPAPPWASRRRRPLRSRRSASNSSSHPPSKSSVDRDRRYRRRARSSKWGSIAFRPPSTPHSPGYWSRHQTAPTRSTSPSPASTRRARACGSLGTARVLHKAVRPRTICLS